MVRQSTDAGSPHAFMFVSRDNGLAFQRRVTANATTVHTGAGSGTAPQWLRLTRSGEVVTAAYSADGAAWTTVGEETLPIGSGPVLIGVALTSHDNTAIATASFEGVTITP
jgi:regulation of enolase protein 1 (concanavalin A-like superfamily)